MIDDSFNSLAMLVNLARLNAKLEKLDKLAGVHDHKRIECYEEFTKSVELLVDGKND